MSSTAVAVRPEPVGVDFAAKCVAVNAEDFSGARLVAVRAVQDTLDKMFFKFAYRLVEQDSSLDHLRHKSFQLIFHDGTLR
jgi:hypothetical protein